MNATLPLCIAQALAPFAPPQSVVHQIIRGRPVREPVEWEEGTCASCSGSGEGMHDGSTCHACKGSGSQLYPVYAADPCDELEPE